jgi:osmoprotectant transport system ATP-binding protein
VSYRVDGRTILDGLSFDVEHCETLVLLGRSGSGKTTALRLINRLLEPTSGSIHLDNQDISQIEPISLRRQMGYVIQDFGLMPHWTVERNVMMIPSLLGWSAEKRGQKVRDLLVQVGLDPAEIGPRRPHQLSGGQRQRVAVARALAADPKLLLFDEPFGALDPVTRHEMQAQFLELRERYHVASIFVTHDLMEALSIATRIAVLDCGKLEVLVTPEDFLHVATPVAQSFVETLP